MTPRPLALALMLLACSGPSGSPRGSDASATDVDAALPSPSSAPSAAARPAPAASAHELAGRGAPPVSPQSGFDRVVSHVDTPGIVPVSTCGNPCYSGPTCSVNLCDPDTCCVVAGKAQCTTLLCNGAFCSADAQCNSKHCSAGDGRCCPTYCNGNCASGSCQSVNGTSCTSNGQCASGFCTDGVCCTTSYCGQCARCDASGTTCVPVSGSPPPGHPACGADNSNPCTQHLCDGTSAASCAGYVSGVSCGPATCTKTGGNWSFQPGGTCSGGSCSSSPVGCGLYGCTAAGCNTSCTTAADCADGVSCSAAGKCVSGGNAGEACSASTPCKPGLSCVDATCCSSPSCAADETCGGPASAARGTCHKKQGVSCTTNDQCGTGICVDSVCCESACAGQCQACDVAGKLGKCTTVSGAPHGTRAKCSTVATDPTCASRCDGFTADKCLYPAAAVACGAATCSGGIEAHVASCDGAGNCGDVKVPCSPFVCNAAGTKCLTACASDADCVPGDSCGASGACIPLVGLGAPCDPSKATGCKSPLACVASFKGSTTGFCCDKADCDLGTSSCALVGKEGLCLKKQGVACAANGECGSGFCVDHVCCDSACSGQCEACDLPDSSGNKGKCSPIAGAPHPGPLSDTGALRSSCSAPTDQPCQAGACDGKEPTKCAGYVGTSTECVAAACKDGKFTPRATCDGAGNCSASAVVDCNGAACADDGKSCKTSCAGDADCLTGFSCDPTKHTCVRVNSHCEGDVSVANDTMVRQDCAPYHCLTNGSCGSNCVSSSDCQTGTVCDTAAGKCVAASDTGSSGGCSTAARGGGSFATFAALAAALALFATRRSNRPR